MVANSAAIVTTVPKTAETKPDRLLGVQEVEVEVPDSSPLGAALDALVTIRNFEGEPRDYTCYVMVSAEAHNKHQLGVLIGPRTDAVTIAGGGETCVSIDVPWELIQPYRSATEFINIDVVVTRLQDERRWFLDRVTVIDAMPVNVTLSAPADVRIGDPVSATITYENPLTSPVERAELTLVGGQGMPIDGTDARQTLPLGTIAPGATGTIQRSLVAKWAGAQVFSAHFFSETIGPGEASATIRVLPPRLPGDMDCDGFVTVNDISGFVLAITNPAGYATQFPDCDIYNADVNGDSVINVSDIGPFVALLSG